MSIIFDDTKMKRCLNAKGEIPVFALNKRLNDCGTECPFSINSLIKGVLT